MLHSFLSLEQLKGLPLLRAFGFEEFPLSIGFVRFQLPKMTLDRRATVTRLGAQDTTAQMGLEESTPATLSSGGVAGLPIALPKWLVILIRRTGNMADYLAPHRQSLGLNCMLL